MAAAIFAMGGAVWVDAPDGKLDRAAVSEKFYPLHSARPAGRWLGFHKLPRMGPDDRRVTYASICNSLWSRVTLCLGGRWPLRDIGTRKQQMLAGSCSNGSMERSTLRIWKSHAQAKCHA